MIPVKEILLTPGHFFGRLCKEEVNLRVPALIILVFGFINGVSAYIVTGRTIAAMSSLGLEGAELIFSIAGFFVGLIAPFIIWIIWAIAFLIMIYILKGKTSFSRVLEITGYGYIPQIPGVIISTAITATSLPDLIIPATSDIQEIQAALKTFTTSAPMVAVTLIGIIFTLWAANIWMFGIREASNLELKKAAICVLVPLVLYILYAISSLIM